MKHVLIMLLLISSLSNSGQTNGAKLSEQYFEFVAYSNGIFAKGSYNIVVQFGEKYLFNDSLSREKLVLKIQFFTEI